MEIILLERVENLGQMGDVVTVKNGYARNFLLPRKKALRASKGNLEYFSQQKKELEAANLKKKSEAEKIAKELDGKFFVVIRQSGESGQLYGSVSSRDVVEAIEKGGFHIERQQVVLDRAIKMIGVAPIKVKLHPEVSVSVNINIAKSADEAKLQENEFLNPTPEKGAKKVVEAEAVVEEVVVASDEAGEDSVEDVAETTDAVSEEKAEATE